MVPSKPPETSRLPSADDARLLTPPVSTRRVKVSLPASRSHTLMVWSLLPENNRLPSADNARLVTALVCPGTARVTEPFSTSHILNVFFSRWAAENSHLLSADNIRQRTMPLWPRRVKVSLPASRSHTLMVWSLLPENSRLPKGYFIRGEDTNYEPFSCLICALFAVSRLLEENTLSEHFMTAYYAVLALDTGT